MKPRSRTNAFSQRRYAPWLMRSVGQNMNISFLAIIALAHTALVRGEDNVKRTVAQELSARIKQSFPYTPVPPQKTEEQPEPGGEIVMMERFSVTESLQFRDLREKIAAADEKQKVEQFSLTKGGAVMKKDVGKARVEIGTWGAGSGLNILKISW